MPWRILWAIGMTERLKPVEVLIVGLGWTGSIMAKELTQAGMSVLALEKGGQAPQADFSSVQTHDELLVQRRWSNYQSLALSTVTFRNKPDESARPLRRHGPFPWANGVGGSGVFWGAMAFRLSPWDFKIRSRTIERYGKARLPEDWATQDLPLTYSDLEPFYDRFERDIGVSGKAGNIKGKIVAGGNPFEGPRSREYPMPPLPETSGQVMFSRVARELGYHPYPLPTAIAAQPYTNPAGLTSGQCTFCGHCAGFTCEMKAKPTPVTSLLPTALATGRLEVRTHAVVTRVNLDSERRRAVSVTYVDGAGREFEQPADLIILSGFTFSNIQLLLVSGVGEPYDPRTGKGQIGRNFSWQRGPRGTMFFDEGKTFPRHMGAGGLGTRIADLQDDNFDHSGVDFIGGGSIGVSVEGSGPIGGVSTPRGTPAFGSEWKRAASHYANRSFGVGAMVQAFGYRNNYLDLDPTYRDVYGNPLLRLTFDFAPNEHRASRYLAGKIEQIMKAMNPSSYVVDGLPAHFDGGQAYRSIHQSGGAIMGDSPDTSAVNSYLQVWGTPNLFVVGATAMPQLGAANPTLHVGAIAYRAADAIIKRYRRKPELMT